jgi:hypothetical protein
MIRKLFKNLSRLAPGRLSMKALRRSKAPAHEPEIHKGSRLGIDRRLISNAASRTVEELQRAGFKAYVVGGAVRDLLLGADSAEFSAGAHHRTAIPAGPCHVWTRDD